MEVQDTRTSEARLKRKEKTKHVQNLENKPSPLFRHCATFFENYWIARKGPPFNFFNALQPAGVSQGSKGPPFYIFRHCDTVLNIIFQKFFLEIF